MNGSTTAIANAVATAASTAFPPRRRTSAPTPAPRGWPAVTQARGTSSWLFVTERREVFTARSFSHGLHSAASAGAGPRAQKRTWGTARSAGSSSSKNSRRVKPNTPARRFVGTLSMLVLRSRTAAL